MKSKLGIVRVCVGSLGILFLCGFMGGPGSSPVTEADESSGTINGVIKDRLVRRAPAAVYIEKIPGKNFSPPQESAVMDQQALKFIPHVLPILVGTTVEFPNNDEVRHSVFTSNKSDNKFNLGTYNVGVIKKVVFDSPGVTTLLCNVHAEMNAYIVAVETPYFGVTDRRGAFSIEGVPPGTYDLTLWHERLRETTVKVNVEAGQAVEVDFGRPKMT